MIGSNNQKTDNERLKDISNFLALIVFQLWIIIAWVAVIYVKLPVHLLVQNRIIH